MTLLILSAMAAPGPISLPEAPAEDTRADVRGTTESIDRIAEQVNALSPTQRADAAVSLGILTKKDPYTRAALQLPFVLNSVVAGIDADQLDPFIRRDWETLQRGLATHVAVLEALGVDFAPILAAEDPLLLTSMQIEQLPALTEQIDAPTRELIAHHSTRVEKSTGITRMCPRGAWHPFPGQPWTLGMQLGGWHDALRRIEPFLNPPETAHVRALIEALDAYELQSRE